MSGIHDIRRELERLREAAGAVPEFPGAVVVARGILKRLRHAYRLNRSCFVPSLIRDLQPIAGALPKYVALAPCPNCHGTGTVGFSKMYKRKCGHCGGWGRVECLPERNANVVKAGAAAGQGRTV